LRRSSLGKTGCGIEVGTLGVWDRNWLQEGRIVFRRALPVKVDLNDFSEVREKPS
jgi:hypothetical protein